MSDNKSNPGEPDRSKINTSEDYEVKYWADKFGVSQDKLRETAKRVGSSPDAVKAALGK